MESEKAETLKVNRQVENVCSRKKKPAAYLCADLFVLSFIFVPLATISLGFSLFIFICSHFRGRHGNGPQQTAATARADQTRLYLPLANASVRTHTHTHTKQCDDAETASVAG